MCIGVHAYWYLWLWYSSPAAEVGVIKVGDELVAVDGESIKGMGFRKVVDTRGDPQNAFAALTPEERLTQTTTLKRSFAKCKAQ